eukprot:7437417-Alexandrium_andersonii.AAC.1
MDSASQGVTEGITGMHAILLATARQAKRGGALLSGASNDLSSGWTQSLRQRLIATLNASKASLVEGKRSRGPGCSCWGRPADPREGALR